MTNSQRVIFNTGVMYAKIVINTILTLLSTRYVLAALGSIDFGLYFVIAGVMLFMGFLTSAMATSSQRHLTYELGRGDFVALQRVFNVSFCLHFMLAVFIILLAESIGLWFLNNILNIPESRNNAAFWVFQFTIVSSASYVLTVPYQALLTAHESLALVAITGIVQSVLNFILALGLSLYVGDRLVIYGFLSCCIVVFINLLQVLMARLRYPESNLAIKRLFKTSVVKELASFSGWSLLGALSVVARSQGLTFLLNIFFGPLANASLGIANQIHGAINQSTQVILQVVSPRLVKLEGEGSREHMLCLSSLICKYTFFIGCLWAVPLFAEMPAVLNLWLKNPPLHSVLFCRLIILIYIFDQLSAALTIPVQAIGNIATSQIISGLIHLSTLPLAYVMIKLGGNDIVVLVSSLITICANAFMRGYLLKIISNFSYYVWFKTVVVRGVFAVAPTIIVVYWMITCNQPSFLRLLLLILVSLLVSILSMIFIGMAKNERSCIYTLLPFYNICKLFK